MYHYAIYIKSKFILSISNSNLLLKVKAAVQFFQHPKVSRTPFSKKQEFLKRKGLTEEEIKRACELVGIDINEQRKFDNQNDYTAISIPDRPPYPHFQMLSSQSTLLQKIKEFFNVTAVIGATLYCVYWFYKVYYLETLNKIYLLIWHKVRYQNFCNFVGIY